MLCPVALRLPGLQGRAEVTGHWRLMLCPVALRLPGLQGRAECRPGKA